MRPRHTAFASTLALAAAFGLAQAPQTQAQTPAQNPVPTSNPPDAKLKDYQLAMRTVMTLPQALATAEAQGQGGRAIDADFEAADGKNPTHWSIKVVYPDGKLVEYGVNADTGALYKTENQPIERYFTRLKPADFQNAKTSLRDALTIAEKQAGGGRAYEAEVEREGSAVQYEIKVALADRSQEVKVGADGTAKLD